MSAVCIYFQVHQPYRIKKYKVFDIGEDGSYFDGPDGDLNNKKIFRKVADKSYLPANSLVLKLLKKHPQFKVSYSLSGVFLDQALEYYPAVLDSFRALIDTGRVEILAETYYHSLSFLYSKPEFVRQVKLHNLKVAQLLGAEPKVFRNTELIYSNELAYEVSKLGYNTILAEGADHILNGKSPNFIYNPPGLSGTKLLLKNYKLSDDIAFRFSSKAWGDYPLTADKFAGWVNAINGNGEIINLFMDYETFGEHQWEDTGIFDFLSHMPREILRHPDNSFVTPSEAAERYDSQGDLDVPYFISWADTERDLSAWLSNDMQQEAARLLYEMEDEVLDCKNKVLLENWRRLQTSDHLYYMCTKWFSDGDVHKYFNPYESPYDAFIYFMNALTDLKMRLKQGGK